MLQNIDINKINPHPDNPRKELGDLSELAESIKANGILQNLTVVPWFSEITGAPADNEKMDGYYRAVIGHRRLAAAKLAGLKEVPCIVSDMDSRDQIATMLLENMQRNDLTVYEQASGFQTMLNLGESVDNIAERTGFSQSTVRRRVKLLELDQDKLKQSSERGATLQDYMKLEEIEDIDVRNNVLDKVGTPNFNNELKSAIDKERCKKNMVWLIAEIIKFATRTENSSGMRYVNAFYASQRDKFTVPEDADTVKYFFVVSDYGYVTLYKEVVHTETETVDSEKQRKTRECKAALIEITKRAYNLRMDFIKNHSGAKKHMHDIMEYFLRISIEGYNEMDAQMFVDILKIETGEADKLKFENISEQFNISPEHVILVAIYCTLESDSNSYYSWNCDYEDDEELDLLYDFLEKLGYQMSDEERALSDGTHKLFSSGDEE